MMLYLFSFATFLPFLALLSFLLDVVLGAKLVRLAERNTVMVERGFFALVPLTG